MQTANEFAKNYLEHTLPLLRVYEEPEFVQVMDLMIKAYQQGNQIFICGNGGSAGTSNHMVNDLSKGTAVADKKRLKVIGLADNMSLLTAYANDCGYETIFEEQLKNLWNPGDLLLAISASGNSENVVRAARYAEDNGGQAVGLLGFSGGKLKEICSVSIHFQSENYGSVEDAQLMFSHLSSQYLRHFIENS